MGVDEDRAHCAGRRLQSLGYDDPGSLNGSNHEAVGKYIDDLWQKVSDILSTPLAQKQIEAVTDALCIKRRLSGRVVRQIIKAVRITPGVGPSLERWAQRDP